LTSFQTTVVPELAFLWFVYDMGTPTAAALAAAKCVADGVVTKTAKAPVVGQDICSAQIVLDGGAAGVPTKIHSGKVHKSCPTHPNGFYTTCSTAVETGGQVSGPGSSGTVYFDVKTSAPVGVHIAHDSHQMLNIFVTFPAEAQPLPQLLQSQ